MLTCVKMFISTILSVQYVALLCRSLEKGAKKENKIIVSIYGAIGAKK
jgi:hypothetical protein